jgi:ubiquinone/menaquinone biosynthesis C-methylase UbiE
VTLTDIAPGLLAIADERARAAGLTNVRVQQADAHELPFPDDEFDRVTCRFAAMYFADAPTAFREARRVLKPGGAAVYLAWGGFDQPIFRDVVGTLFRYVQPPEDEPDAPSPFKFAEPGTLTRTLKEAGFVKVEEANATLATTFHGNPERWWEWFTAMAAPLQALIASLTPQDRERALAEIYATLRVYYDGGAIRMPIEVVIASGSKAA